MEPIDFVIIWVDGGDPEWQKQKDYYRNGGKQEEQSKVDAQDNRYRDWENLKYWFRAVETYAPWVNKVHFVTCGHVPEWLNLDCPKLHFVKHSDFIPEEYLPTFSSHPIELNLHRIPGLSDHFVYFNDDFFLGAPVTPQDFFRKGLPCDCLVEKVSRVGYYELYVNIRINDLIFCNQHYDRKDCMKKHWKKWFSMKAAKRDSLRNLYFSFLSCRDFFGLDIHHLPQSYLKSTLEQVWDMDPKVLHETCTHKFRDMRDVSQCVFKFSQLLEGNFAPYDKRKNGKYYNLGTELDQAVAAIEAQKYKIVCVNDAKVEDFEGSKRKLCDAFEKTFPKKSAFEK